MTTNPPLLVPMQLHAMVLNGRQRTMRRWEMNYRNLEQFQAPEPAPFHTDVEDDWASQSKNLGVYLQWNLPAALRHGTQTESEISFPVVPNRWLVLRFSGDPTARTATAWVVESDQPNSDLGDGSPHALGSTYLDPRAGTVQQIRLGRSQPLSGWQEPGESGITLRAVAPGNIHFSAFQSTSNNIFSFHDNLVTQGITESTLSYLVVGWFSKAEEDPLAQASDLAARLEELNWEVSGSGQADRSLYHGMVTGIPWKQGTDHIPSPRDTAETDVSVAVGYTAIDALTALVGHQLSQAGSDLDPMLLEAFHYGMLELLDQPGGRGITRDRLREKWYGFSDGGLQWEIVDATPPDSSESQPTPPTPEQLAAENSWLGPLNQVQAELNQRLTELQGLQRQLYELWWKRGYASWYYATQLRWPFGTNQAQFDAAFDPTRPDSLVSQVYAKLQQINGLLPQVPHATETQSLDEAAEAYATSRGLPATRRLKPNALNRFRHANDPVLLISGVNHPNLVDFLDRLPCRWPDQVVAGFIFQSVPISLNQVKGLIPKPTGWELLPFAADSIAALLGEFYLSDPTNAEAIALELLKSGDPGLVQQLKAAMGPGLQPTAGGQLPPFGLEPWEQAWMPLFLEWQVTWYPIPYQTEQGRLWTFDGLDYQFDQVIPQPSPQTVTGRSTLTPQAQNTFKRQLESFIRQHPDQSLLEQLDQFISQVDNWDFLSQAMEGFSTQIGLRNPAAMLSPENQPVIQSLGLAELIGEGHFFPPQSLEAIPADPWNVGDSKFEGLRSGQFVIERLSLVDRFGQVIEVITSQTAPSFDRLIVAEGLQPTRPVIRVQPNRVVQLAPRLLQDGRLAFTFVDASGDSPQPIQPGSGLNPIIGWVLPNHLDQALSIYGQEGTYLGQLYVAVDGAGARSVQWEPALLNGRSIEQLRQQDPELGRFLQGVTRQSADSFFTFLEVIDKTLWSVDPLGNRADQNLSVLVGRPLALARARLSFELQEAPLQDPRWPDTFKADPKNPLFLYNQYPFDIRLGSQLNRQDGLIGYFLNGEYDKFNAIHQPEGSETPFIDLIRPGNFIPLSFADGAAAQVTMLIDPRAGVHAYTGLFPALRLDLPSPYVEQALSQMQVTFHLGPLLGHLQTTIDPESNVITTSLQTPLPAEKGGTWSWLQRQGEQVVELELAPEDQTARLRDELPALREGLLQLKGAMDQK